MRGGDATIVHKASDPGGAWDGKTDPMTARAGPTPIAARWTAWWKRQRKRTTDRERDTRYAAAYREVERLRGVHRGERCFLVASGPSIQELDLGRLVNERVMAVNRAYHALRRGLPHVDFYVLVDKDCYREHSAEIKRAPLGTRLYQSWILDLPEYLAAPEPAVALRLDRSRAMTDGAGCFATDLARGFYSVPRGTVIIAALQVAYHLGFREVVLLGVDLDFTRERQHFYASSRGEAHRRGRMDLTAVLRSFEICRRAYEADDRRIVNASPEGTLNVLERAEYTSLF